MAGQGPQEWLAQMQAWQEVGATHVSVGTGGGVVKSPQEHIDALRRFKEVVA